MNEQKKNQTNNNHLDMLSTATMDWMESQRLIKGGITMKYAHTKPKNYELSFERASKRREFDAKQDSKIKQRVRGGLGQSSCLSHLQASQQML